MERGLIVGVGVVCGSCVMFTAAMCCSRPERQHSLRDVGLRRERIGALGDRRDRRVLPAGASDDPATSSSARSQRATCHIPLRSNTLLYYDQYLR